MASTKDLLADLAKHEYASDVAKIMCNDNWQNETVKGLLASVYYASSDEKDFFNIALEHPGHYRSGSDYDEIRSQFERGDVEVPGLVEMILKDSTWSARRIVTAIWPAYYVKRRQAGAEDYEPLDTDLLGKIHAEFCLKTSGDWPQLADLRSAPVKVPLDGFPAGIKEYVQEVSKKLEVDHDMITGLILGALGSAVTNTVRVEFHDRHEPLNPAILILADSGERKTPAFEAVMGPLREIQLELEERNLEAIDDREIDLGMIKAKLAQATGKVKKEHSAGDPPASHASPSKNGTGPAIAGPVVVPAGAASAAAMSVSASEDDLRKLRKAELVLSKPGLRFGSLVDNVTPEALGELLGLSWTAFVTMLSDETDIFEHGSGMYGSKGMSKWQTYLKAISGSGLKITRKGILDRTLPWSCLSMLVMTQPRIYENFIKNNSTTDENGFSARMAVIYPREMSGFRTNERYAADSLVMGIWPKIVTRLKRSAIAFIEDGIRAQKLEDETAGVVKADRFVKYRVMTTSELCYQEIIAWRKRHEKELRAGGRLSSVKSWYEKSAARALVIAALFTLCDDCDATAVDLKYVRHGLDIVDALVVHTLYASESRGESEARLILDHIEAHRESLFTVKATGEPREGLVSDVQQVMRKHAWVKASGGKQKFDEMFQLLNDLGYLKINVRRPPPGSTGRSSRSFIMRPRYL